LNGAESAGPHLAIGTVLGAGLGLAAALDTLYGTLSLVCAAGEDDLRILAEQGAFESPDCALTAYPSTTGSGFQHTIGQTGEHLAGIRVSVRYPDSAGDSLYELHSAINTIIDDVAAPDSLTATRDGFDVRSRDVTTLETIADRIAALARARSESTGAPVVVDRLAVFGPVQPSRILARRIKTFAGSLKMRQDRVVKEPLGPPTAWGAVSQVTPTAIARFPIEPPGTSAGQGDARDQMRLMSKALTSTGLDVLGDVEFRGFSEGELIRGLRERGIRREPRRWLGVHPVLPPKHPGTSTVNPPDVIVRGPGLPEPTLDDLTGKDEE
jgi:metal-dependent amidase/aminoacylase/carboxypeptidase family protein